MVPVHHPFSLLVDHIPVKSFQIWVCPGNTKGEVSLYHWPPVWLVWNQLYDYWQVLFIYLQNRLIQTSQTGGQWYSDISI
jgi:hypothetical protein